MNPAPVPSIGLLDDGASVGQAKRLPCDGGMYACVLAPAFSDLELDADGGFYVIGGPNHYTLSAEAA
jgi:hypothetical protein